MSMEAGRMMMRRMAWIVWMSIEVINCSARVMLFPFPIVARVSIIVMFVVTALSMRRIVMMSIVRRKSRAGVSERGTIIVVVQVMVESLFRARRMAVKMTSSRPVWVIARTRRMRNSIHRTFRQAFSGSTERRSASRSR